MSKWKDQAIETYLVPLLEILTEDIDTDFSKIEFVAWFEEDVSGTSQRAFDAKNKIIMPSPQSKMRSLSREGEIEGLLESFRAEFLAQDEPWVAMYVVITGDGDFDLQFDYDDPHKFKFRKK